MVLGVVKPCQAACSSEWYLENILAFQKRIRSKQGDSLILKWPLAWTYVDQHLKNRHDEESDDKFNRWPRVRNFAYHGSCLPSCPTDTCLEVRSELKERNTSLNSLRFRFYALVKQDLTEEIKFSCIKALSCFLNTCLYGPKFKFCFLLQTMFFHVTENLTAGSCSSRLHMFTIWGGKTIPFPSAPWSLHPNSCLKRLRKQSWLAF